MKTKSFSPAAFMREYNDTHRSEFNDELFQRSDDKIIDGLKEIILKCERSNSFIIKVEKFTVVENYSEIYNILHKYEEDRLKNKKPADNKYNYIAIKDSDIKLLLVDYFIAIQPNNPEGYQEKRTRCIIQVPRIVDKYYFRLLGNKYMTTRQISESTYNNSSTNSKMPTVTWRTVFMASRIYRMNLTNNKDGTARMKTADGEVMQGILYGSRIFGKQVYVANYILAKYGIVGFQQLTRISHFIVVDSIPEGYNSDDYYIIKRHSLFIIIPKFIYDADLVAQSLTYTVFSCIQKHTTVEEIYTLEYWLKALGKCFTNAENLDKGLSILESLEGIYDGITKEDLHLPPEDKENVYLVLVWIIREFSSLRVKDNLDLGMKRYRWETYIASLYAVKLSKGIFRLSDRGNRLTLEAIEKAIVTYPDFLLKTISKNSLVKYANYVNDLDSIEALSYSYKGLSGLGDNGLDAGVRGKPQTVTSAAIPPKYRQVHKSHLGRLDLNSSPVSDPGLSGILCPMAKTYNGSFSNDSEPNTWRKDIDELLEQYRILSGMKEAFRFKKIAGLDSDDEINVAFLDDSINTIKGLSVPVMEQEDDSMHNNIIDQAIEYAFTIYDLDEDE